MNISQKQNLAGSTNKPEAIKNERNIQIITDVILTELGRFVIEDTILGKQEKNALE